MNESFDARAEMNRLRTESNHGDPFANAFPR